VQDALIGAAIGLVLIYLGTRIPFRILSWLVIGIGVLFVVVMSSFVCVVIWTRLRADVRPLLSRLRGHVRHDPQLGTLMRETKFRCWVATLTRGDRQVEIRIDGDDEPDPRLLAEARDLATRFDAIERRVEDYLAREADDATASDPELTAEIRALRVSGMVLRSSDRPGHAAIDLDGPDEVRYWYCDYTNGELTGLDYDT
jgi:hypothetical protein